MEELEKLGIHHTGTLNLGGSIATASGLTFIGATNDSRLRAFDSRTGRELWSSPIDAPAYTVPVTYKGRDGRQYVAVVAGGGGYWGSPAGTSVIAFALPPGAF
jgi:quinoprotein glucose dehydrogenase